jgi:recombination protein RecA
LKFYSSIRLDIRRISALKEGEEVVGSRIRVKVVKNKLAAPFKQAEFDVMHGEGVNRWGELVDLGSAKNVVDKSGAWYSYKGERIGQGRDSAIQFLKDNPALAEDIRKEVFVAYGMRVPGGSLKAPQAEASAAPVKSDSKADGKTEAKAATAPIANKGKAGHA